MSAGVPPPPPPPPAAPGGGGGLVEDPVRVVVILGHDAVVGVEALAVAVAESVRAIVLVAEDREPAVRAPEELQSDAGCGIEPAVRLPAVDEPGLDLELVG